MNEPLKIYTIYKWPSDYPGKIVVRKWHYDQPTDWVRVCSTLKEARDSLPNHWLVRLDRMEGDDPCILETWL